MTLKIKSGFIKINYIGNIDTRGKSPVELKMYAKNRALKIYTEARHWLLLFSFDII